MIQDPPNTTGVSVWQELLESAVGIAGAGQNFDGNGRYLRSTPAGGWNAVQTGNLGSQGPLFGNAVLAPLGTRPAFPGEGAAPQEQHGVLSERRAEPQPGHHRGGAMRRALKAHRKDFIAIVALVAGALAVAAYVLYHQPLFMFGQSYYTVRAEFATSAAVTPGQGQAITIAGVQVGLVGGVQLEDGRAVVTMNIFKKYAPIYRDATVLLRPRTPLKDMYLAVDPGTRQAGTVPNGGMLGAGSTAPDIDLDEILASLDSDTRSYLLLLLSGGAGAFQNPATAVPALQGTLKRFAPLARDARMFATLLAARSHNLSLSIHNLQRVATALGGVDGQLASLIESSNTNFAAISSQDANLEAGLALLPGTLNQTNQTLGKERASPTSWARR